MAMCESGTFVCGARVALMLASLCVCGRLHGVEVSFEDEETGVTVEKLMTRDGARIFTEFDGMDSLVVDKVSPVGTKCLQMKTRIPSSGICFGTTTNESGQVGGGIVQQDARILSLGCHVMLTMFDEALESVPLAGSSAVKSSPNIGGGFYLVAARRGLAVAVDEDIAVYALDLTEANEPIAATNWCVVAGARVGDDVVSRSFTLEGVNGNPLPAVGEGWHQITFKRKIADSAVRYSIFIDGLETRPVGEFETDFLAAASSSADPVRALRFVGQGCVSRIVLPDEIEATPCLFGYDDLGGVGTGREIVSYLGEGPSIVIPAEIDGVAVMAARSLVCANPENIREIVVPANIPIGGLDDFWNLERIVFADEIPFAKVPMSVLPKILMRADAIYYPRSAAAKWCKALKNLGYGGRYGSYSGIWSGESCIDAKAVPSGFVNVIAEIKSSGGVVAVPDSWPSSYPKFQKMFGSDLPQALTLPSGKLDASGRPMQVWQDYVAGTDPTDLESKFMASVSVKDGKPVVSWTPELSAEETAKRVYKIFGKKSLFDADWTEVGAGSEVMYNFFKVTVEMK